MVIKTENKKGFLVMEGPAQDFGAIGCGIDGGVCVCDYCNKGILPSQKCYYIAVLNMIKCEECYEEWIDYATRYSEDIPVEERNYHNFKTRLKEVNLWKE